MDLATLVGLVSGISIIAAAILIGSEADVFFSIPALMIVFGGTFAATLIKFPLSHCLSAMKVAFHAFRGEQLEHPLKLISIANHLAEIVRRDGILAIDEEPVENEFLKKGLDLAIDGHPSEFVQKVLREDMEMSSYRHEVGQRIFRAIGESAPAFGMIGTLVGLVQMLVNLQDPKAIGPAMAVALLTTLYGALLAHLIALPIADKLELRGEQERISKMLIIEGIAAIQDGQNPKVMDELLEAFLPRSEREQLAVELAARKRQRSDLPDLDIELKQGKTEGSEAEQKPETPS